MNKILPREGKSGDGKWSEREPDDGQGRKAGKAP